jgi:hypothetical protein
MWLRTKNLDLHVLSHIILERNWVPMNRRQTELENYRSDRRKVWIACVVAFVILTYLRKYLEATIAAGGETSIAQMIHYGLAVAYLVLAVVFFWFNYQNNIKYFALATGKHPSAATGVALAIPVIGQILVNQEFRRRGRS